MGENGKVISKYLTMNDFDKNIIDKMISFGFNLHSTVTEEDGIFEEYRYYPSYLDGQHYKLSLFKYSQSGYNIHRLYIYNGSIMQSLYQIQTSSNSYDNYILDKLNKIFEAEVRMATINNILHND